MLDWLIEILEKFGDLIVSVLPVSPFKPYLEEFANIPYLGYLNWFLPIKGMCIIMLAWLTAVTTFYLYSIIMRWIKMIGD